MGRHQQPGGRSCVMRAQVVRLCIGAMALPADGAPFNQERERDTCQHDTPQHILIESPDPHFDEERDDRGDQEGRSCETAVKRAIATEIEAHAAASAAKSIVSPYDFRHLLPAWPRP